MRSNTESELIHIAIPLVYYLIAPPSPAMLQQWSGVGLHECRSIGVWLVSKGAHLAAEQYLSTLPPTTATQPASQRWDKPGNNALPPSLISPCEEVFFYQLCQDPLLLGLTNRSFTLQLRFETFPPPLTNHTSDVRSFSPQESSRWTVCNWADKSCWRLIVTDSGWWR